MRRDNLSDLRVFIAVAREQSFTKAAAKLGVSQSALSYTIRTMEARLGVRLLTRTTRSVSLTEAGERLLRSVGPRLDEIESELSALGALRDKPAGTVRITATKHAVTSILMPVLPRFLSAYPDIRVDLFVDDSLTDIVAERLDAGIRFGDIVEKDMIAIRIGKDIRMMVVGAPAYFADRPIPRTPRNLSDHRCINYELPRSGRLYAWDFQEKGRPYSVRVDGPLVFNNSDLIHEAALAGHGLAYVYADTVAADIKAGRLVKVLEKWCPQFPGYYLYHPSRRQTPPALAALIAALRYKS